MGQWHVVVQAVVDADTAEEAGAVFREWLATGRRVAEVAALDESGDQAGVAEAVVIG